MPPRALEQALPCPAKPSAKCALVVRCPEGPSKDGAYKITWSLARGDEAVGGGTYVLRENDAQLYKGGDQASSVSGRRAGDYRYRVGVVEGGTVKSWSKVCAVKVEPPSLVSAMSVFGVGLFVFVATVVLVLVGHRRHKRERLEQAPRPPGDDA